VAEELAPMKPQVYKDPRPAEYFDRFYERSSTRRPDWVYELVRLILTPYLVFFFRARCIDSDKIPVEGPAIVAPNHFSFLDHFFVAVYLRRKVHFMAKSQLFKRPMQFIYTHGGVFPVRRGHRDAKSLATAKTILGRGDLIVMYAEGGRSRTGELGEAKPGVGKLALETGVAVVPTAIVGTERARNWKRLQFPKVTVQYGDPIRFERVEEATREQAQAAADAIFAEIKTLHTALRETNGRKKAIAAARRARRSAAGATRRPDPAR
jgi:1-acyl-sn-glycerol-3-phosphate acyltransferase